MFVENNKFMLGKYVFQRHFPPLCVHFLCLSVYTWLFTLIIHSLAIYWEMIWWKILFSSSENCEQTRKVEGNESDRILRIMNVLQSLWRETLFVDVAMGYSRVFSRYFRMNMIISLPISKSTRYGAVHLVCTFSHFHFWWQFGVLFISLGLRCGKVKEENT